MRMRRSQAKGACSEGQRSLFGGFDRVKEKRRGKAGSFDRVNALIKRDFGTDGPVIAHCGTFFQQILFGGARAYRPIFWRCCAVPWFRGGNARGRVPRGPVGGEIAADLVETERPERSGFVSPLGQR